jgi:hypothetical protein
MVGSPNDRFAPKAVIDRLYSIISSVRSKTGCRHLDPDRFGRCDVLIVTNFSACSTGMSASFSLTRDP